MLFFFSPFHCVISVVLKEELCKDSMYLVHWQGWKLSVNIFDTKEGRANASEQMFPY